MSRLGIIGLLVVLLACNEHEANVLDTNWEEDIATVQAKLMPLHQAPAPAQPGQWLYEHEENGQTFQEYINSKPTTLTETRNKLYIQLLGEFNTTEDSIIRITADYLHRYYNIPVEIMETFSIDKFPSKSKRINDITGEMQMHTLYIMYNILEPRIPEDAAAFIALTATDLYPDPDWNFVFGQASVKKRVGVWSINRFGDPTESKEAFDLCLSRALKTASHEVGHMFSMRHCIAYECNMAGSNHIYEADGQPHYLCPECMPKVCWNMEVGETYRYQQLKEFWNIYGFKEEVDFYDQSIKALTAQP